MRWITGTSRRERRLRTASLLAALAGLAFVFWVALFSPLDSLQNAFSDRLFREREGSENVVIVAVDDAALAEHGRLGEWPRSLHATAIHNLSEAGARVIVYDFLFVDEGANDAELTTAIADAGNVILAVAGTTEVGSIGGLPTYEDFAEPAEPMRSAANVLAHAHIDPDGDGRVRKIPIAAADSTGTQYPALSLAAVYLQFGQQPPDELPAGDSLDLFGRDVPLEEHRTLRINYAGSGSQFTALPFNDVLDGTFDPALVRNRIVLVGATASGIDVQPVPVGRISGVEIQANAIDTLLNANFLRPVPDPVNVIAALLFVFIAAAVIPRWRLAFGVALTAAIGAAWIGAGVLLFNEGYILNFPEPPIALLIAAGVALVYRTAAERAAGQEVTDLFGRYVSHELATELVTRADLGDLQLGGEMREVTVMFCDMRGFTPLSQRMKPPEMVQLLNMQFDVIVSSILKHSGVVHQFAGDAVMAFWNAPKDQADHALLACRTAIEAQKALEAIPLFGQAVRYGFGINTGTVLAGNVGTAGRLEYTVVGDPVNRASRFCGVADGGEIWIGERTYELIAGQIETEALAPQQLKGVNEPVQLYRIKR